MKKLISLIIIFVMTVSLAACISPVKDGDKESKDEIGGTDSNQTNPGEETEKLSAFDTVEKEDYDGHVFNILYPQVGDGHLDFYATGENGSIMNDDVFKRNLKVKDALDIDIAIEWTSNDAVNNTIKNYVTAGTYDYDMYGGHRTSLVLAYSGYLYDFYDIDQVDLTGEWWDQDWVSTMSVNNSLYALVGDISIKSLLFVSSICFNKNLFDANGLEYPYEAVRNNTWTYDLLLQYMNNYSEDLNNDGSLTWESDRFGIVGWGSEAGFSLFYGSGFGFVSKTSDDVLELNFNSERLISIMEKVLAVWSKNDSYFNNSGASAQHHQPFTVFTEGRALFCDTVLTKVGMFLLDMSDDYGIVPQPMFDENQGRYYSYTGYTIPITMVPSNCTNPDRTGTIIEAFCTASYDDVTPDMYEIVTAVKNVRDGDSSEMIGIIIRTKIFDAAHWYNISGYGNLSRSIITSGINTVASTVKSYNKAAESNLKSITDAFDKLG